MFAEHGIKIVQREFRRLLKPPHVFCRCEELHKRAVQKAVKLRAAGAEEVIPLPQPLDHLLGGEPGLGAFVIRKGLLEPSLCEGQQLAFGDEVAAQTGGAGLHVEGDPTKQILFVIHVKKREPFVLQMAVDVPLVG